MLRGETLHSPLPWDIPWWMPDHAIFFGVLYAVIGALCIGLAYTCLLTFRDMMSGDSDHH